MNKTKNNELLNRKKRIAIITTGFPPNKNDSSDASVFVRDFAISLTNENYDIYVLTPAKKFSKQNEYEKITVEFFPWIQDKRGFGPASLNPKNPLDFLKLLSLIISGIFYTIKFVRRHKIDFCLAMWAVPSGMFTLITKKLFKIPYSVLALGSDIQSTPNYPVGNYFLKRILDNSNHLFADGFNLAKEVKNISKRNCGYISTVRSLNPEIRKINYTKFDKTKTNFMYLGRYHDAKGPDLLIEAIGLLNDSEKKRSLFHFFGKGTLDYEMKQKVKKLNLTNNVFINNFLDGKELFSYLSQTDFVIIPSIRETLSMVLFEAIQANKPVLSTNVGDTADLITKYDVGFVVEPNPRSISEGIRKALSSSQNQFSVGIVQLKEYLEMEKKKGLKTFVRSLPF